MWRDLSVALCLVLVIEGVLPFLVPSRWRQLIGQLAGLDDRSIRLLGLTAMLAGTGLLYLIR